MKFGKKMILGGDWGAPSAQNWLQGVPRHCQGEAKLPKSGPKEAQSGTKDGQRGALGGKNGGQGTPREAFWRDNLVTNKIFVDFGEHFCQEVDFAEFIVLLK